MPCLPVSALAERVPVSLLRGDFLCLEAVKLYGYQEQDKVLEFPPTRRVCHRVIPPSDVSSDLELLNQLYYFYKMLST